MEKNIKETKIPEDYSKALANQSFLIGPAFIDKIVQVMFDGVSTMLSRMKSTTVPKAIVFRSIDHSFLAGAKVEFIANGSDPSNGRWDYIWTFYEDDLKEADCIEATGNSLVATGLAEAGMRLFNMKFNSVDLSVLMSVVFLEMLISWLKENASAEEAATLNLDGVFTATATVEDDEVVMGIVPSGEMKVIIKNDSAIQEN